MDVMSHREYKLWCRRINTSWNQPSRSDWYSMQIAAIIESYMAKQIVDIQSKKLHFDDKDQLPDFDNMTHEEIMEYANGISQQRLAQLQEEYEARKKAEQYQ